MAAPHVAGVAALILEGDPSASPAEITAALLDNATPGLVPNPKGSPNLLLSTEFLGDGDGDGGGDGGPNSCQDSCGDQATGGCYCDTLCTQYGDCCADYSSVC